MNPNGLDYFVGITNNQFTSVERLPPNNRIAVRGEHERMYRVLPRSRAEQWIEHGSLRVSPLDSYREAHLLTRRDAREGKLRYVASGDNRFSWIADHSLCLALSRFPLRHLVRKFTTDEHDACVMLEITNPNQWLVELDNTVRSACIKQRWPIVASVANEVAYSDMPGLDFGPAGAAINCAFLKPHIAVDKNGPNHYWLEGEIRVIWQAACGASAQHLCVQSSSLATGCRVLGDDELLGEGVFQSLRVRKYGEEKHSEWLKSLGNPLGLAAWNRGNAGNAGG